MDKPDSLRVAVIGGSYGGLCTGLAMRCIGADVHVYEQSDQHDRIGGGIVVQPDFAEYLEAFGYARPEAVAVATKKRQFLNRDGTTKATARDGVFYTGWDTVLRALRQSMDPARLHSGHRLASLRQTDTAVIAAFEDGVEESFDLVVGADGIGSTVRGIVDPDTHPWYAGYVGFRGLVPESDLSADQLDQLRDSFTLFDYPHSHILSYLIPGERGELDEGHRRFNWVWYVGVPASDLSSLLIDRRGRQHRASIGPGDMTHRWVSWLRKKAEKDLPPQLAGAVAATSEPFAQCIFDLAVSKMVHDRVLLLGDSAFLVRPHTAAGASKAAADAIALAHAIEDRGLNNATLDGWELQRMSVNHQIAARGLRIAAQGGLGS